MAKKTAKAITRLQKFLAAIAGDTTPPEPVTNDERLLYNIAEKVSDDQFVVKLTPTSESGGTMDRSNAEILEAYMNGKRVMFDIPVGSAACRVQATLAAAFEGFEYPSFNAYGIDTSGTTIINLYVDPSDEESYTFTMDTVEIGGGNLPEVSTLDTGKTLMAIGDTWDISGGSTVMIAQFYNNGNDSCSKSFDTLDNYSRVIADGVTFSVGNLLADFSSYGECGLVPLLRTNIGSSNYFRAHAIVLKNSDNKFYLITGKLDNDNTVTITESLVTLGY